MDEEEIEEEFGIPFPGKILPQEQWTQAALKKLPEQGPLDLKSIFGREAPLVLDLGCGNGRFVVSSACGRPEFDHIGIDILPLVIRYATRRAKQRGLANVRFAVRGASEFLGELVAPRSVREIHIYHPQPYHDSEKAERRLLTPEFLLLVHSRLEPQGSFVLQTDNAAYWSYLRPNVAHFFRFQERSAPWPDAPQGRTRREIIARSQGLKIFRGSGTPLDLDPASALELARKLPLPRFSTQKPGRKPGKRR